MHCILHSFSISNSVAMDETCRKDEAAVPSKAHRLKHINSLAPTYSQKYLVYRCTICHTFRHMPSEAALMSKAPQQL